MQAQRILGQIRAGQSPHAEDLTWFAQGLGDGRISDAQAGAFAMGICRNGLDMAATVALTKAMRDSGEVLQWDLPGPVVDKHSTGG
ncbi:MAG: thymidine phosphorylase, partial [Mangrovicoccus sp.]|nr:thymidine phosphorylase [Mangrovicoccus sp.]